jgi:GDSL-like Lipase/Acylhydrolase family
LIVKIMVKSTQAALIALAMAYSSLCSAAAADSQLELSHERYYAIKAEIDLANKPVVVFGDSIVEGAPLPKSICGLPVINAGVTGAAIEYFRNHARELLGSSRPALIVLAVGINDASSIASQTFRQYYRETAALLSRAAPLVVATITPVRSGPGSVGYDASLVPDLNQIIKATPERRGVIDLNTALSNADLTTDGIHLGADGYALWLKTMIEGIAKAEGC